jgi:hypothetical protein
MRTVQIRRDSSGDSDIGTARVNASMIDVGGQAKTVKSRHDTLNPSFCTALNSLHTLVPCYVEQQRLYYPARSVVSLSYSSPSQSDHLSSTDQ